jgi:large subunit ribosomal protein L33
MAKPGNREIISLACEECNSRNYTTTKNKRNTPDRITLSKYCPVCRAHRPHKQVK